MGNLAFLLSSSLMHFLCGLYTLGFIPFGLRILLQAALYAYLTLARCYGAFKCRGNFIVTWKMWATKVIKQVISIFYSEYQNLISLPTDKINVMPPRPVFLLSSGNV